LKFRENNLKSKHPIFIHLLSTNLQNLRNFEVDKKIIIKENSFTEIKKSGKVPLFNSG
jgi:hypothetical protein